MSLADAPPPNCACPVYSIMLEIDIMNTPGRPRSRLGRRGTLGERLRQARNAMKVTQAKAAEAIGVSHVTVARWETGSHRPRGPAARYVGMWIAAALGEEVNLEG